MKYYILKTSKSEIPIDEEEVEKVIKGVGSGSVVVLKKGIFNPSFFDSIVEDHERQNGWNRDLGQGKHVGTSRTPLIDDFRKVVDRMRIGGVHKQIQSHE